MHYSGCSLKINYSGHVQIDELFDYFNSVSKTMQSYGTEEEDVSGF